MHDFIAPARKNFAVPYRGRRIEGKLALRMFITPDDAMPLQTGCHHLVIVSTEVRELAFNGGRCAGVGTDLDLIRLLPVGNANGAENPVAAGDESESVDDGRG